jgi:hypothetical protein
LSTGSKKPTDLRKRILNNMEERLTSKEISGISMILMRMTMEVRRRKRKPLPYQEDRALSLIELSLEPLT